MKCLTDKQKVARKLLGWVASISLAFCGLPQLVYTATTWDASGLSWSFLAMWAGGEAGLLLYLLTGNYVDRVLLFNYGFNVVITWSLLAIKLHNWLG